MIERKQMIVRVNKDVIIIIKPSNPITSEKEKAFDELAHVLGLDLAAILKSGQKFNARMDILMRHLASASNEMK